MNHVFRVIWNTALGCWVAVAEVSSARGKASRSKKAGVALSAALLTLGAAAADAGPPSAVDLDTFFQNLSVVNGNGGSGCMVGIAIAACSTPSSLSNVTFTDFVTQGGAGSGGGAGLGGAVFVNTGAELTLTNVQFTGNVVKGGEGGGPPDVRVQSATIALVEREANVVPLTSFNITPTLVSNDGGDTYTVSTINLGAANSLMKVGQQVTVEGATGTATIASISGTTVTLASALTISSSAIRSLTDDNLGIDEIAVANNADNKAQITGAALTDLGSSGSFAVGSTVIGTGIDAGTVVTDVIRDGSNVITAVVLSKPVTAPLEGVPDFV